MGKEENMAIREHYIDIPLTDSALEKLELGDIVFLTGTIFTGREGVYRQLFEKGAKPPLDIKRISNVTFHCSPAVSEVAPGQYNIKSVTGTASFRFAKYMKEFIDNYSIKAVIGKTGMPPETYKEVFKKNKTVYLNTIGYGLGALYGAGIKRVKDVIWKEELGLAQAMWFLEVEKLGPFMVECDTKGNNLFELENEEINKRLSVLYEGLQQPTLKRLGEITSAFEEMV